MATSVATKESGNIRPSFLAAKAKRIRELMITWTENTIELGTELKAARDGFDVGPNNSRPGWKDWLRDEVGISDDHSQRLIRISDRFRADGRKLATSFKVLDFLSRENTPEAGREEVVERIGRGEKIGGGRAKEIVDSHRPKPKEANRIAKETGKATLASDGYLYLGASKEQAKETEERRTVVYAVRRAVETLSSMEVTPHQFLTLALPHQLWNPKEEAQLARALKWLTALNAAWEHHE